MSDLALLVGMEKEAGHSLLRNSFFWHIRFGGLDDP